jgi:hypothetical protein
MRDMDIVKTVASELAILAAIGGLLMLLHAVGVPEWLLIATPIYYLVLLHFTKR